MPYGKIKLKNDAIPTINSESQNQGFQKLRVATSSNVLHKNVSSFLNYLSIENENYKTTAKFISHMEKWFALTTSRNIYTAISRKMNINIKKLLHS